MIEVEDLVQGYGRKRVLDGLSVHWPAGVVGLVGPNGAGKTTLLNTVATLVPPQAGTVRLAGVDTSSAAGRRRARALVGYVPQAFGFPPRVTVRDFVAYVAWLKAVPAASIDAACDRALELVDLTGRAGQRLGSLSGGMLQRAGLAQALVNRPPVLILDEPTVGLDPEQRAHFRDLIGSLEDTCVVISTHLLEDVAATAGLVAVMAEGRIAFAGTLGELAARGGDDGASDLEAGYVAVLRGQR